MDELVFTPAALIDLLSQIDELKELDIMLSEAIDGAIILQAGNSTYEVKPKQETTVDVEPTVVDAIADANEEAYNELTDDMELSDTPVDIEAGPIKELLKTLLVGGMVRLGVKTLKE